MYCIEYVCFSCAVIAHEAVYAVGECYVLLGYIFEVYYLYRVEGHAAKCLFDAKGTKKNEYAVQFWGVYLSVVLL